MKLFLGLLVAVAAVVTTAERSNAELILSVDLDSATAGIQSANSTALSVGDEITATFYLQMTSPSQLSAFNFSAQWGSGLSFVSRSESTPWTSGWLSDLDTTNAVSNGSAFRFDGGTLSASGQTTPVSASPVGTLTLKVVGPGDTFVNAGFFEPDSDFMVAPNGDILNGATSLVGGTVNVAAVPEPSSMALLATAGIGGWVARRRAARKQAAK